MPKQYLLPDWINDFVETQALKEIDRFSPRKKAVALYNLGRIPRDEACRVIEDHIPKQDAEGRYLMDNTVQGFPDDLMRHIHTAQGIQETLSSVVHRRPFRPFTFVPVWTPCQMEERICARDWKDGVWGAGSHTGCDIYVLYMNVQMGLERYRYALDAALAVCAAYQSPEDGMWGLPGSEPCNRVNGTMKILSKVHYVQECHLPFADKIIDYVLDYSQHTVRDYLPDLIKRNDLNTMCCHIIDILFCFEYAAKITDYRLQDIREDVYGLLPLIDRIRPMSGSHIGLLQGAIRRIVKLCGMADKLGWPDKIYRFPKK